MLACTRDRQILVFKRDGGARPYAFSLNKRVKEAHTRILWALSWSHDDKLFATASRENKKAVKVWKGITESAEEIGTLDSELPNGATP